MRRVKIILSLVLTVSSQPDVENIILWQKGGFSLEAEEQDGRLQANIEVCITINFREVRTYRDF